MARQVRQGLECFHKSLHPVLQVKAAFDKLPFLFFLNQSSGRYESMG